LSAPARWRWKGLETREALLLVFFAGFIVAARAAFRWHLHIQGHSMFFTALLLVVARACIPRVGAATLAGALAGALSALLGMGKGGPLLVLKLALPGLVVDGAAGPGSRRVFDLRAGAALGALAGLTDFVPVAIVETLAGVPVDLMLAHAAVSAGAKAVFGGAGGLAGVALARRLRHHGLLPESSASGP
jgi:hypothetical protein